MQATSTPAFSTVPRKAPGRAASGIPEAPTLAGAAETLSGAPALRLEVKAALRDDVIAACKALSREQLADKLAAAVAEPVSLARLEKIYNPAKPEKRLPADWIPAWCEATGSVRVVEIICARLGLRLVEPHVARIGALRIAELEAAREQMEVLEEIA